MIPKQGLKFLHKYWTGPNGTPLVYQVSAIRNGTVYVREVGEKKAKEHVPIDSWGKVYGSPA